MQVYFIGAGPGDPELLTLKGRRIMETAEIVLYAGSLVNPELLEWAKADAGIYNTATMHLEEITGVMYVNKEKEGHIARLHTGDPSLYSSIGEQIAFCIQEQIPYEVVPGVSSFSASAAVLGKELTLPGISQSVVITRKGGRTPVPPRESLENFAKTGATMILFLSAGMVRDAMEEIEPYYGGDTPAVAVYRASWPDQKICRATISTLSEAMQKEGIERQALIIVGPVLEARGGGRSKLYDPAFSHGYRKAGKNCIL